MSTAWVGVGVSKGVVVAPLQLWLTDPHPPLSDPIPHESVAHEIDRFAHSRGRARTELESLRARVSEVLGRSYAGILDAQALIVDDPELVSETIERIRVDRVNARWALQQVVGNHLRRFRQIDDPYLRERSGDLQEIHRRLQRLLADGERTPHDLPGGRCIVVAPQLGPGDAVALAERGVVGLATDGGGRTSHTAILAQALGVPAVAGLRDITRRVRDGEIAVLDGSDGTVRVGMSAPERADAERVAERWRREQTQVDLGNANAFVGTADGVEIVLRGNVEFANEATELQRFGARGVGLYRSEFLFLKHATGVPTEEDHVRAYRQVAAIAAPHLTVVRTFDLGGEKAFQELLGAAEANPALGMRGVRSSLARLDLFRPQLRALMRVAAEYPLRAMLPMVCDPREVTRVRELLAEESGHLTACGIVHQPQLALGVMIEVPAAAADADAFAAVADFLSVGTNDLIQYALAVDRGNAAVQELYQPAHPGVVRLLRRVVAAASRAGIELAVCGEMAADPSSIELLVGLGVRELSVPPRALPSIRAVIATIDTAQARNHVESVLAVRPDRSLGEEIRS